MRGILTISLDFELHWGGFEKWPLNERYKNYFLNTRRCIPTLLSLFEQSNIHVTWATVGLLMHITKGELLEHVPQVLPEYEVKKLSAYNYIREAGIGENESTDPFHYAGSLIDAIKKVPGQEIGTHTFSHYYCNEIGQGSEQFRHDLQASRSAAVAWDVTLKSLVFPRNQYNPEYLSVCAEEGIQIVRVNPIDWWWQINGTQNESMWKRLNRGLDAYMSIGGKTSYSLDAITIESGVFLLPASRLLRPYRPKEFVLNRLKIEKIKKEMLVAAQNNEVYHLWWHPHNFGNHTQQNIDGLVEIANHFRRLHEEFGMVSRNMGEIAELLYNGAQT
ncbi:hypothetical protein C900_03594 [Fulvivirga imtechensis AK7]|uniref:Polysaccharide deacetylase n=1 Tax=Fulvivirga imtechensis AK7 TaxID=1237149 RepID=L8JQW6_9BACT|nr:polysaccharide deacetylase family protein [Fulvivirga imtechensis]ELR70613.1 hypothetical protein C900_03594 [Fulvivirga imtechensis AK7]